MLASLILILHLSGLVTLESAVTSLYITGALLLIAEIAVVSFGLIALNGLIALFAAYSLQTGNLVFLGIPVGWNVLFGIAFVEVLIISAVIFVYIWIRKQAHSSGTEAMIGQRAKVVNWDGQKGNVSFEGENWKAESKEALDLNTGEEVTIDRVAKLKLIIKAS